MNLAGLVGSYQQTNAAGVLPNIEIVSVIAHTVAAGVVIGSFAYVLDYVLSKKSNNTEQDPVQRLINACNLLLVCVGVGGMMLLIEQSLIRAVVLFAAIAVVRFRVRVSEKSLGSSFFFAVIAGMAGGLGEFNLTWLFTSLFVGISLVLSMVFRFAVPNHQTALLELENLKALK